MKQKVVIKLGGMNGNWEHKSRSKALKIAVGTAGVQSAGFTGKELDQIEVVGEGIDAALLTSLLRKNVGPADLLIVDSSAADDKKDDKKIDQIIPLPAVTSWFWNSYPCQFSNTSPHYPIYHYPVPPEYTNRPSDSCSIM